MPRPSGQERARIQTERRKARDAQRAAAAAEAAKKPKPIYNRRGRIVGYKDPVLEPEKAESQKPQGGQGTKPGSSKDDTARKITNSPPRQSEPPLKYPQDLGRLLEGKNGIGQDMIKFSALEYKPVGNSLISPSGKASERFLEPNGSQKSLIDIYLPIPQDINSANTAGWSDKDFSAVYAALYRVSKGAGEIGAGDNTVDGVRQEVATALQESGLMGKEGLDLITTKVGSAAANALTGANVGLDDILSRQAGVIVNPNKELLFNSVSLREFGFSS